MVLVVLLTSLLLVVARSQPIHASGARSGERARRAERTVVVVTMEENGAVYETDVLLIVWGTLWSRMAMEPNGSRGVGRLFCWNAGLCPAAQGDDPHNSHRSVSTSAVDVVASPS
ncbi:hypothetical protein C8F01DRAFT_1139952 [Mycena amicta]|nr:hypothetical protein C8F01DRAFT_1139952 [Mycena amicta]